MMTKSVKTLLALSGVVILLAGCGGGSDNSASNKDSGNSTVQSTMINITPDNGKQIAGDVYKSLSLLGWAGQSISNSFTCKAETKLSKGIGALELTTWLFTNIRKPIEEFREDWKDQIGNIVKGGIDALSCEPNFSSDDGGSMDPDFDLSKDLEVSATLDFNNCGINLFDGTATAEGGIEFGLENNAEEGHYQFNVGFDDTKLVLPNGHSFYSINGGYDVSLGSQTLWPLNELEANLVFSGDNLSFNFEDDRAECQENAGERKISDFSMTLTVDVPNNSYSYSYAGKLKLPLGQEVRYKTSVAFKNQGSDYPVSGKMEFFDKEEDPESGDSKPKMTMIVGTGGSDIEGTQESEECAYYNVCLALDMDDDGTSEVNLVHSWADFLSRP